MEIHLSRDVLKQGLYWVQSVVEKKTTKPILTNALLETNAGVLKISATDLELSMTVEIPAQIRSSGRVAVPAKSLYEIAREASAEQITLRRQEGQWLEVLSGNSKFKMVVLPADEFPALPAIEKKFFQLDGSALRQMIEKTLFATSVEESKYSSASVHLNGIYLESLGDKKLRMVATDGHRLSWAEREMEKGPSLEKGVLLPRKGVLEMQKLIREGEGSLPLAVEGKHVVVKKDSVTLFVRLLEGDFPDYRQVVPQQQENAVWFQREEIMRALRRVSLLSQEHHRGVRFTFSSGHLELLCSNPDLGEAREEIRCDYSGKHLEIGFNYRYFLDVLAVLEDEMVLLDFKDEISPCVIRSVKDPGFLGLIMPMRL